MIRTINPDGIAAPASAYNHAYLVEGAERLVFLSGQLGEAPDGSCAAGAGEQAVQAWKNVRAILADADMDFSNVVKVTSYIVGAENISAYVDVHKSIHEGMLPPWTLVVVAALGRPEYLVEIDVTAAG